jgi:putative Mn2+ efflux pump MntP
MTFLGWLAGSTIARFISRVDHWVAFALLAFVGARMLRSGFNSQKEENCPDPSHGGSLMMICIATSIDAMAVGLSMAMLEVNLLLSCLIIGIVTLGLSLFGLLAGCRLGDKFGKRMELVGGLILIGIGMRILYSHLFIG